jgi:hypothetical protein
MYHVEEASDVDVELLAECGQIAQRLRSFEHQAWCIDLKDLQKRSLQPFGTPPVASSHSITQKLNDIFDINENTTGVTVKFDDNNSYDNSDSVELLSRIRYLEDIVIKIHYQQELLRQTSSSSAAANQHNKRKIFIKNNMNYSASSENNNSSLTTNNNNDLTTSTTAIHSCNETAHDVQLSSINIAPTSTGCRDNKVNKSTHDADDIDDKKDQSVGSRQSQNIHHQQQQLCSKISSDDLKLLLCELKRKVDYTEKMNWLCECPHYALLTSFPISSSACV